MATELREYLNNIVEEKNAKVIPTNIRKGITLYGVEGTLEEGIDTTDATAVASTILQGETAYVNDEKIEGTMANNAELTYSPSDEEQAIPEGYTSGGRVEATDITRLNEYQACLALANSIENLEDFSDTTATAEDILEGKTAYSNGEKLVGLMKVNNANVVLDFTKVTQATHSNMLRLNPAVISVSEAHLENYAPAIFANCSNMKNIDKITLKNVTSIAELFHTCSNLVTLPEFDTSGVTDMRAMCAKCTSLVDVPIYNTSSLVSTGLYYTFGSCPNLSDDSLNNIMKMCIDSPITYEEYICLQQVGLSSAQIEKCRTLSNYDAFIAAGWREV